MNFPNDVKIAVVVLIAFGIAFVVSRKPGEVRRELFVPAVVVSPYDINGDGFISDDDAAIYAEMFKRLNFNGDSQVDIFDQTMLAGEIVKVYKVYLPIIFQ